MQFASAIGLDRGVGLRVLPVLGVKTHVWPTAPSPTITHLMLVFEAMVVSTGPCVRGGHDALLACSPIAGAGHVHHRLCFAHFCSVLSQKCNVIIAESSSE